MNSKYGKKRQERVEEGFYAARMENSARRSDYRHRSPDNRDRRSSVRREETINILKRWIGEVVDVFESEGRVDKPVSKVLIMDVYDDGNFRVSSPRSINQSPTEHDMFVDAVARLGNRAIYVHPSRQTAQTSV